MRRGVSLAVLLLAAALAAAAQPLYKWIDESGKTQYSDKPPKGFKGEVTKIDTEVEKTTLPPAPAAAPPAKAKAAAPPKEDIAAKRRATRAHLEARLNSARARVDTARKALDDAENPTAEERQIIQQRKGGGMHGMNTARQNCRWETVGGKKSLMCPTAVPTEEYHDRVAKLEQDLRSAEEELEAAQTAWRRGVD